MKEDRRKKRQVKNLIEKCKSCKIYEKGSGKCAKYNCRPLHALATCKYKYYRAIEKNRLSAKDLSQ